MEQNQKYGGVLFVGGKMVIFPTYMYVGGGGRLPPGATQTHTTAALLSVLLYTTLVRSADSDRISKSRPYQSFS